VPIEASATLAEGRYRLIEVIGSGGMASVYRAYDTRLQVPRAIKVLLPALANRERLRKRFEAEARTMALLEHRNIVRVYDVGNDGNRVYIVMELVDGGSLVDRLEAHGALPPRQAVDVCMHVLAGLSVAHDRHIIHRDIKPHNVLLTSDGEVRVTDFGIARVAERDDNLTKTGAIMGTWGFMAPEQRDNSKGVDARADLYSVAATLYSCVTNQTPTELFAAALDSKMLARVPEPLAEVIRKATAYDRNDRYADAAEMSTALAAARERLPLVPPDAPPLVVRAAWAEARPAQAKPLAPPPVEPSPAQTPAPHRPVVEPWRAPAEPGTPTMIPDRIPSPPAGDNRTFEAFGAEADLAGLEEQAVAAVRPPRPEVSVADLPMPATADSGASLSGDSVDLELPPPRQRWWLAPIAVAALGALGTVGWWLATDHGDPPVEPRPAPVEPVALPPPVPTEPTVAPVPIEPAPAAPSIEPVPVEPTPAPPTHPRPTHTTTPRQPAPAPAPAPVARPDPEVDPAPAAATSTAPPVLIHDAVRNASLGSTVEFAASIAHGRYTVTLYYRPAASGAAYRAKPMIQRGATYSTTLAVDDSFASGIEYHLRAVPEEPGLKDLSSGSGFSPHRIAVQ
jgi:serine/threonine-protein kinase